MKRIMLVLILLVLVACGGKGFNDFKEDMQKKAEDKSLIITEVNSTVFIATEEMNDWSELEIYNGIMFGDDYFVINRNNSRYTLVTDGKFVYGGADGTSECNIQKNTCDNELSEKYNEIRNTILMEFDLDIEDYGFGGN